MADKTTPAVAPGQRDFWETHTDDDGSMKGISHYADYVLRVIGVDQVPSTRSAGMIWAVECEVIKAPDSELFPPDSFTMSVSTGNAGRDSMLGAMRDWLAEAPGEDSGIPIRVEHVTTRAGNDFYTLRSAQGATK